MNFRLKILKYLFIDLPKRIKPKISTDISFMVGKDLIKYNVGTKFYYCFKNHKFHHQYIPAIILPIQSTWYYNGKIHRKRGPAITYFNGDEEWFYHGRLHRKKGPAFNYKNRKYWLENGVPHREDGPAIIENNRAEWWIKGNKINCNSNDEFLRIKKIISFY